MTATEKLAARLTAGWGLELAREAAAELRRLHAENERLTATLAATPAATFTPEWLWSKLMDWCRQRGMNPAEHNALFRIVSESRKLAATPAAPPTNIRERWNIERDGDALLVCFNDHEKGEGCRYKRFVPEAATPAAPQGYVAVEIYAAWRRVGADVAGLKWDDFVEALRKGKESA